MDPTTAPVILHLRIRVPLARQEAFRAYVAEAFPVFEAGGDCQGAVYRIGDDPEAFDEVFYYASEAAYRAGEAALSTDPRQQALLARWRALLAGPPGVEVVRRWS